MQKEEFLLPFRVLVGLKMKWASRDCQKKIKFNFTCKENPHRHNIPKTSKIRYICHPELRRGHYNPNNMNLLPGELQIGTDYTRFCYTKETLFSASKEIRGRCQRYDS